MTTATDRELAVAARIPAGLEMPPGAAEGPAPGPTPMRAVQITRSGGPEVLDIVDLPDPTPGDGEQVYAGSAAAWRRGGRRPRSG